MCPDTVLFYQGFNLPRHDVLHEAEQRPGALGHDRPSQTRERDAASAQPASAFKSSERFENMENLINGLLSNGLGLERWKKWDYEGW